MDTKDSDLVSIAQVQGVYILPIEVTSTDHDIVGALWINNDFGTIGYNGFGYSIGYLEDEGLVLYING